MKQSSIRNACCGVAAVMSLGVILSSCGAGGGDTATGGAEQASLSTQRQFDDYWAKQRGESVPEAAPKEEKPVEEAETDETVATEEEGSATTWWGGKKKEKAPEEPEAEPKVVETPVAVEEPEKNKGFSWWWEKKGDESEEEPEKVEKKAEPAPVKEEKTTPGVAVKRGESIDLSKLDLSGKFPTAVKVDGNAGYVFSPYDNRKINVKGVPSGTLVADPRYELSERKYFIVP